MTNKSVSAINYFCGIVYFFGIVLALFSLMDFFKIPLPNMLDEALGISMLFCVEPLYILFGDILGLQIGIVGDYCIFFAIFSFYLLLFIFSIALGARQYYGYHSFALLVFIEILDLILFIFCLLTIIVYIIMESFVSVLLFPLLISIFVSLLSIIMNIVWQKNESYVFA